MVNGDKDFFTQRNPGMNKYRKKTLLSWFDDLTISSKTVNPFLYSEFLSLLFQSDTERSQSGASIIYQKKKISCSQSPHDWNCTDWAPLHDRDNYRFLGLLNFSMINSLDPRHSDPEWFSAAYYGSLREPKSASKEICTPTSLHPHSTS